MGDSGETPLYENVSKVGSRRDGFPFLLMAFPVTIWSSLQVVKHGYYDPFKWSV